ATPSTLRQSAGLRFARNDTRFFEIGAIPGIPGRTASRGCLHIENHEIENPAWRSPRRWSAIEQTPHPVRDMPPRFPLKIVDALAFPAVHRTLFRPDEAMTDATGST